MKSSSKRRFLPINSGWKDAAQSDRPPKIGFARKPHCTPVSYRKLRLTQQKKRQRTLRPICCSVQSKEQRERKGEGAMRMTVQEAKQAMQSEWVSIAPEIR